MSRPEIKNTNFNFKKWLLSHWQKLIILYFLVGLAYSNSLANQFVSDDIGTIAKNYSLNYPGVIFSSLIGSLRLLFYHLIIQFFGRSPLVFRLLNLGFHLATVSLSYLILSLLAGPTIAFLASAIFSVHPLQIESVTWISGGNYSQGGFFTLLTLWFYLQSIHKKRYFYYCLISFILAFISMEKAISLIFILPLFSLIFPKYRPNLKKLIIIIILGILGVAYLALKIPGRIATLENQYYVKPEISNPLLQVPVAIANYLQLIFWPNNLAFYHTELGVTATKYALCLLVFGAYLGLTIYFYKRHKFLFFWLAFFLLILLPTLNPFNIGWAVAERYGYLAYLGIYVAIAVVIDYLLTLSERGSVYSRRARYFIITGFILIIIALTTRTILRNIDWQNEDNLWLSGIRTSPSSAQNHNNLGDYYFRHGELDKAISEFKITINLNPAYADAYHNLANIYYQQKRWAEAKEAYQKAIEINPKLWQSYQNLAGISYEEGKAGESEKYLEQALAINPQNASLLTNLALLYMKKNEFPEAREKLQQALLIDPNNQTVLRLLSQL